MSVKTKYRLQVGLWLDVDGHDIKVISINGNQARVREKWIAEDTLEVVIRTDTYNVVVIDDCKYLQSKNYPDFRLCANAAFNYPWNEDEQKEVEMEIKCYG